LPGVDVDPSKVDVINIAEQIEKEIGVARAEVREARHERRSGH
jgi:hypothetical protein